MLKVKWTFVALLLLSNYCFSQVKLQSIEFYKWNSGKFSYDITSRYMLTYDSSGTKREMRLDNLNQNNEWEYKTKTNYTYTGNGILSEYFVQNYNLNTKSWDDCHHVAISYNQFEQIEQNLISYFNLTTKEFELTSRETYFYNSLLIDSQLYENYNLSKSEWEIYYKIITDYYPDNKPKSIIKSFWIEKEQSWKPFNKLEYSYNIQSAYYTETNYIKEDKKDWEKNIQITTYLNTLEEDSLVIQQYFDLNNSKWRNNLLTKYDYYSDGRLLSKTIFIWDNNLKEWIESIKELYIYQNYSYSQDIILHPEYQIFPNPASDFIFVNNLKYLHYSIADQNGQIVTQSTISDGKINVSDLIKGKYFLVFINEKEKITLPFLKL